MTLKRDTPNAKLGLRLSSVEEEANQSRVMQVAGLAAAAGLKVGDILFAVNDVRVNTTHEAMSMLSNSGRDVKITFRRFSFRRARPIAYATRVDHLTPPTVTLPHVPCPISQCTYMCFACMLRRARVACVAVNVCTCRRMFSLKGTEGWCWHALNF